MNPRYFATLTLLFAQLRSLLAIPPTQAVIFERFSDSAGSYTILDRDNPSVYKQLYRAAKAKLKLRIKVTVLQDHSGPSTTPQETVQEAPALAERLEPQRYVRAAVTEELSAMNKPDTCAVSSHVEVAPQSPIPAVQATENLQRQAHDLYLNNIIPTSAFQEGFEKHFGITQAPAPAAQNNSEATTSAKKGPTEEAPVPRSFTARESFFSELANLSNCRSLNVHNVDHPVNIHGSYSVFCNECDQAIPGAHYHCSICDDGDFDLCQSCVDAGFLCGGEGHWLIKRVVKNGKVINSVTETIAPKSLKAGTEKEVPGAFTSDMKDNNGVDFETRTCNSCVGGKLLHCSRREGKAYSGWLVFPESKFVTCTVCEDYDLCFPCLFGMKHGHHPSHELKAATHKTLLSVVATRLCAPGRNMLHFAVCDGCDSVRVPT